MIKVLTSGLHTSIQDLGRFGFRKYGVPVSGAMDLFSAELANRLVGNPAHEAVMEITLQGPILQFDCHARVALTGADLSPTVNNKAVSMNKDFMVKSGSILRFGAPNYGARCYLAIAGGIDSEEHLGSASFCHGISPKSQLVKGDAIRLRSQNPLDAISHASVKIEPEHFTSSLLKVYPGPEYHLLSKEHQKRWESLSFQVDPNSNRMAYLLRTEEPLFAPEILSAPVQPGTVQLTPSGKFVVLMRDAQTTGGYARILQLSDKAMNQLAQKHPLEEVRFGFIDN
ncbi:MAG: biotin-dependent carboxyltransferase family protein [Flavobacteriaceae bacterium]|nr:biotin-dependent carboxyltransferase family protein [Flavobacteriaceae bacterium]